MSMQGKSSLSPTYARMEIPVPEPEPTPEPPRQVGRPPGSRNKPKPPPKPKRDIPWYRIVRTLCWWTVAALSGLWLYWGVEGTLGQSIAYLFLSVYVVVAAFLLDRDGKKMRT